MKLILITGHATEGKTTLSGRIASMFGAKPYSLATPIKLLTARMFELLDQPIPDDKETYRPYLQRVGTDIAREVFSDTIWCETLERRAKDESLVVCDDIRRIDEVEYFRRKHEVFVIRIVNPEYKPNANSTHISESEIDSIPYDFKQIRTESHEPLFEALRSFIGDH